MNEPKYKKFPYRIVFPDSSEDPQNSTNLEDALQSASWRLNRVWKKDGPWGRAGEPTTDADRAVITNRNTGYRWITRARRPEVEFQTPKMFEDLVAEQGINIYLTIEEAEALARAAKRDAPPQDARHRALTNQALDQIAHVCRRARGRIEGGESHLAHGYAGILHARPFPPPAESGEGHGDKEELERTPRPPYRPLSDPDNLSLKEAGEILGKARNTVHGWYKKGEFPPAVDVAKFVGQRKPVLVVPRYRLEAWQAGERMPAIFQEVFESHGLREPPWRCWSVRKGASKEDVAFWIKRRALKKARSKKGKRIYGEELTEDTVYELPD